MHAITELLQQLVSIDSVNPDLMPGGAGEAEIARFVADWRRLYTPAPRRQNSSCGEM